jgi:hypothetical protein
MQAVDRTGPAVPFHCYALDSPNMKAAEKMQWGELKKNSGSLLL